jgi:hypothetical protein
MGNIICIKARSHSDFELYLIGEKYDIPYDFLIDYKKNRSVYKFWTEVGSGRIMAIEERPSDKEKVFVPVSPMSVSDEKRLKSITPIIAGDAISKYRGDIEEKEQEFKDMIAKKEEHKKKMLNRKYDPSNIVCINARCTPEQLFAICIANEIDFVEPAGFIISNSHMAMSRVWYEKKTSHLVAYEYICDQQECFDISDECLIPKNAIYKMSRKPVATPKLKATYDSACEYRRAKKLGFDIDIPKLDAFEFEKEEKTCDYIDIESFAIEDLENLLEAAIESEDYESAAELRDAIEEMKKKSDRK